MDLTLLRCHQHHRGLFAQLVPLPHGWNTNAKGMGLNGLFGQQVIYRRFKALPLAWTSGVSQACSFPTLNTCPARRWHVVSQPALSAACAWEKQLQLTTLASESWHSSQGQRSPLQKSKDAFHKHINPQWDAMMRNYNRRPGLCFGNKRWQCQPFPRTAMPASFWGTECAHPILKSSEHRLLLIF